jgi:plasmid stabilization system protein ParE
MSAGFTLHPDAFADLEEIRDHIARENPDAADRVMTEIFEAIAALVPLPDQGHR